MVQIEFSPSISEAEDMALSVADKKWILEEIKGRGWRKIVVFLKEWGIPALIGGAIVLAVVEWNHFTNDSAAFRQHTEDRLHTIEIKLDIQAALQSSPSAALNKLAKMDQRDFATYLPVLRKVAEIPAAEVKPDNSALQEIALHLRSTSESSPDYWPAVLQFINFATAGLSPSAPPSGPPTAGLRHVYAEKPGLVVLPPFKNQVVILDGVEMWDLTFQNCRIIFTQNPVKMHNFTFIDCVFEMPVTDTPNPRLKIASQLLLASDLTSVKIASL